MLPAAPLRTKLLVLLALPVSVLLALAGLAVHGALGEAKQARTAANVAADSAEVEALAVALREERQARLAGLLREQRGTTSEVTAAAPPVEEAARRAQRAEQDADLATLDRVDDLEGLESLRADVGPRPSPIDREGFAAAREELLGTTSVVELRDGYEELLAGLVARQRLEAAQVEAGEAAQRLDLLMAVRELTDLVAAEHAAAMPVLDRGAFAGDEGATIRRLAAAADSAEREAYLLMASDEREAYQELMAADTVSRVEDLRGAVRLGRRLPEEPADIAAGYRSLTAGLEELGARLASDTAAIAEAEAAAAQRQAGVVGGGVGLVVLLTLALTGLLLRRTVAPLRRLTTAAKDVADTRLPRLVDTLGHQHPDAVAPADLAPIRVDSGDEVGELALALERIRTTAVATAWELSEATRRGVSDLFVSVARRNQALLDRQVATVEALEAETADPLALERLGLVDHLAMRMRRNATSLLVLAEADEPRAWDAHLPLDEVVDAAVGELEEQRRVEVGTIAHAAVAGDAAPDLAHLLAELLENAAGSSPPTQMVRLDVVRDAGGLLLTIDDAGPGMTPDELAAANRILSDPPPTGFGMSGSLGLVVCGLLAQRHGVSVTLDHGSRGGVSARVVVPGCLLGGDDARVGTSRLPATPDAPEASEASDAPDPAGPPGPGAGNGAPSGSDRLARSLGGGGLGGARGASGNGRANGDAGGGPGDDRQP